MVGGRFSSRAEWRKEISNGSAVAFKYDREGDILYIDKVPPYAEQDTEEWGDDGIVRFNPDTGAIENLEVLFFSTRLLRSDFFSLLVTVDLRVARKPGA